jgi:hypothetical protein
MSVSDTAPTLGVCHHVSTRAEEEQMPKKAAKAVLPRPPEVDSDWAERIERAKRAREQGRKLRKGRPAVPAARSTCGLPHR